MINKLARSVSENLASQVQDKLTTKHEWHAFTCTMNHDFAVKIGVDVQLDHVMRVYESLRCPQCNSAKLRKQANL